MHGFVNKQKGAISVFLVIIMLPMMLFSWLLIDSARIKMARSRVVNATDITLNTALSNFDNILKDMYGLFAMSQNSDELFENLETYYTKNLMIAGLDEDDAESLSNNIIYSLMNLSNGNSNPDYPYADFLTPELDQFSLGLTHTASVANHEILKDQIVNFMKYRAPLGIGMKLIDIVKSFKTVGEQASVIENKTKYYESQSKLENHLRNAWANIEKYMKLYKNDQNNAPLSSRKLNDTLDRFNKTTETSFYSIYQQNIRDRIADTYVMTEPTNDPLLLYATYWSWNFKYLDWPYYVSETDDKYTVKDQQGAEIYIIDFDNSQTNTSNTNNNSEGDGDNHNDNEENNDDESQPATISTEDKERMENLFSRFWNITVGYSNYSIFPNGGTEVVDQEIDRLDDKEKVLFKALIIRTFSKYGNNWKNDLAELLNLISQNAQYLRENNLTGGDRGEGYNYTRFLRNLVQISYYFEKTSNKFPDVGNYNVIGNTLIKPIKDFHNVLEEAEGYLKNACDELNSAVGILTGSLEENRNNWENSLKGEIQGTAFERDNTSELESVKDKFSLEDINKFIELINGKKVGLAELRYKVELLQFCEYPVYEISSFYQYYNLYTSKFSLSEENWYYKIGHIGNEGQITGGQDGFWTVKNRLDTENPFGKNSVKYDYNLGDPKYLEFATNSGKLYNYMSKVYKGAGDDTTSSTSEDSEEGKNKKNEVKNQNEKLRKPDTGNTNNDKGFKSKTGDSLKELISDEFPSKVNLAKLDEGETTSNGGANNPKFGDFGNVGQPQGDDWDNSTNSMDGAGSGASGFFKELFDKLEDIRDLLYIEEYIMGMFSYQTLEKEKFIDKYISDISKSGSIADQFQYTGFHLYTESGDLLQNGYGIDVTSVENFSVEDIQNCIETLTNIPMSPKYNELYLNEVEYIVYGSSSSDGVGNTIFALRFILNTISAFMNSELRSIARTIAMAIFGTPPLTFLVPIAQIAIIIACAIGESMIDKELILGGFSVPVFKTKDNFIVSPRGMVSQAKNFVVNKAKKVVKQGISYVKGKVEECVNYLSSKADEGINTLDTATKDDLEKALGGAYDETVGGYVDEVTNALIELVNSNLTIEYSSDSPSVDYNRVIQNVKNGLKEYLGLNEMDQGGLMYKVKNAAYNYIVTKMDTELNQLVESLDQTIPHDYDLGEDNGENVEEMDLTQSPIASLSVPAKIRKAVLDAISNTSGQVVDGAFNELRSIKNNMVSTVMSKVDQGADKLEKAADDFIDGLVEKIPGTDNVVSSDAGKTITLGYSGYLRLFLLIALAKDEPAVLKRTADVIQLNMRKVEGIPTYKLSSAYCYLDISVQSRVNPLFFSFDGINRLLGRTGSNATGLQSMYRIQYNQKSGY